jgi:hypothetical protein
MKVQSRYYRPLQIFFTAERGIAISRFQDETEKTIDSVYSVNPACPVGPEDRTGVRYENCNSAESTNSCDDPK